jgi:restriction system protein
VARRSRSNGSYGGLAVAVVIVVVLWGWLSSAGNGSGWLGALLLLGIVVAAVWLVRRFSGPKTPTAQELARRFEMVRAMSGPQFEAFVADLFRAMGHRATLLGGAGDQGVDVIVDYGGERVAVQCKNYKRAVGNKPVQEVFAGARHHRCKQAWVVAPLGYTRGARELARSTGVSLFDASAVGRWIGQVDRLEKERAEQAAPSRPDAGDGADEAAVMEARRRASWQPHPDDPS